MKKYWIKPLNITGIVPAIITLDEISLDSFVFKKGWNPQNKKKNGSQLKMPAQVFIWSGLINLYVVLLFAWMKLVINIIKPEIMKG